MIFIKTFLQKIGYGFGFGFGFGMGVSYMILQKKDK